MLDHSTVKHSTVTASEAAILEDDNHSLMLVKPGQGYTSPPKNTLHSQTGNSSTQQTPAIVTSLEMNGLGGKPLDVYKGKNKGNMH